MGIIQYLYVLHELYIQKVNFLKLGFESGICVVANRENNTCFGNRLVMGIADCVIYAGLDKTPKKSFTHQFGPLPDTLQTGTCIFPPFPRFICVTDSIIWLASFQ